MNVLSLFDGMGCGWIALRELGIKVDRGYSSEVDKYAIAQVKLNFPEVIHLGSVTDIDVPKLEHIDLLIGGSPCQSFSLAGKRIGMSTKGNEGIYTLERYMELKGNGFQFEGQSYLFWEYMRILTDIRKYNPDVLFLLENVEMEKKWESVLSEAVGLRGVHINSALVSAQNRRRIYWTNIRVGHEGLFGYKCLPCKKRETFGGCKGISRPSDSKRVFPTHGIPVTSSGNCCNQVRCSSKCDCQSVGRMAGSHKSNSCSRWRQHTYSNIICKAGFGITKERILEKMLITGK